MAFLWFLGYDIDDHSILSKARRRFGKEVYEAFFRKVLEICSGAGLVEGDRVYLDSTLLKANASFDSVVSKRLNCQLPAPGCKKFVDDLWEENEPKGEKTNQVTVTRTDPDCSIIHTKHKGTFLAHKVHVAVDGGRSRIVTAIAVTPRCRSRTQAGSVPGGQAHVQLWEEAPRGRSGSGVRQAGRVPFPTITGNNPHNPQAPNSNHAGAQKARVGFHLRP